MVAVASLFTSDREQRLWSWVLILVVTIYSTLWLTPTVSGALRSRGLLGAFFVIGLILVVATIVAHGLEARPRGSEIVVGLGIAAVYLMVFVRIALPEERTHLIEYGVVAVLVHAALVERSKNHRVVPFAALTAVLMTALIGALDEGLQTLVPGRVFDARDILFNTLAGTMAVASSVALRGARRRRNLGVHR